MQAWTATQTWQLPASAAALPMARAAAAAPAAGTPAAPDAGWFRG